MLKYCEIRTNFEVGISRLSLGILFSSILMLTITGLSLPVEANSTDENIEFDEYEWTVLAGEELLNDPMTAKILKNIEPIVFDLLEKWINHDPEKTGVFIGRVLDMVWRADPLSRARGIYRGFFFQRHS